MSSERIILENGKLTITGLNEPGMDIICALIDEVPVHSTAPKNASVRVERISRSVGRASGRSR